jgi:DNA-dependent RNA polymerase auxiliary subunit epsilon
MNKIKSFIKKLFYKKKRLRTPSTEKTHAIYSKHNDLMSLSRKFLYIKYKVDDRFAYGGIDVMECNTWYPINYLINMVYNRYYSTEDSLLSKFHENLKESKWWD